MDAFEKALAEAIAADGGELSEVKDQDGNILKKGDIVGFKAGMEQEGKIVKISGKQITVKSLDREGFSGGYAAGQEYYDVMADDCWKEESVGASGEPVEEAKGRQWTASGYLEFKTDDRISPQERKAIAAYMKRWANGAENAGPSMLPKNKRWKFHSVIGHGDKLEVNFATDAEPNVLTLNNIEQEIIGKDGFGGMLWSFVHDSSSPDHLDKHLYGGYWQADDDMRPVRRVNANIVVGLGELPGGKIESVEERRWLMARNPFGHALYEDAQGELAALVGEKGAERIFEALEDRLVVEVDEEVEPNGPELDERQMEQGVRYEIVNVQPGDFGGIGKHQGERSVKVLGNTFAIKDELKKLGFRFNRDDKSWELKHEYTSWGKARGAKRDTVEAAIKQIHNIVKDANDAIQKRNQAALAGAGVSDDTRPAPTDLKGQIKSVMSGQRLTARLKKNGIGIYFDWPHSIGGFGKGGAFDAWVVGDTFNVKDQLKKFGFSFSRRVPSEIVAKAKKDGIKRVDAGWVMDGATYDRINKQVDQTLLRAAEGTL